MIRTRLRTLNLLAHAARPRHLLLALAMLGGAAGPAAAQSLGLGRLFTTPDERMALEIRRSSAPAPSLPSAMPQTAAGPAPEAAAPAPPPEPALLNGVVRRSSGKSTVWINGVPYADSGAQLRSDQSVKLRLSSGRALVLKPGQRFNPADGTVQEAAGR
ncbi:hypothetical protein [Rugamonas apoptosis]|uniref:MSHA biogenesis protein MshK n=1 Tax=Rugamonas apoptosis TaxID=2758570 RepID=A0A7W2F9H0_9BURK|nr:hypothetical protein [Rugamonas apoptosis]MBA5687552.1 hypothetical protein [Rugamonas apoptosis]